MSHHLGERRDGETVPAGEYQSSVGSDTDRRAPHVCLVADSRSPGGVGSKSVATAGSPISPEDTGTRRGWLLQASADVKPELDSLGLAPLCDGGQLGSQPQPYPFLINRH